MDTVHSDSLGRYGEEASTTLMDCKNDPKSLFLKDQQTMFGPPDVLMSTLKEYVYWMKCISVGILDQQYWTS